MYAVSKNFFPKRKKTRKCTKWGGTIYSIYVLIFSKILSVSWINIKILDKNQFMGDLAQPNKLFSVSQNFYFIIASDKFI